MRLLSLVIMLAFVMITDRLSANEVAVRGGEERRPQERNVQGSRHQEELNDRDLYEKNRANLEGQNQFRRPVNVNVNGAGNQVPVAPTPYPYPSDNSQQQ